MNFSVYVPLLGCICNALLAVLVYFSNPRRTLNRVYALLGLSIASWNLGQYHLFVTPSKQEAVFWLHFEWVPIIMGPVLLFHLSLMVAERRIRRWHLALPYTVCTIFAALSFTDFIIRDARLLDTSGWYAVAGPGLYLFHPVFTALVVLSIVVLARRRAVVPALQRKKLDALILAQSLLLFSGLNDVLPIMGHDHYPFTDTLVYPYGSVAAVFYGIIVGYSVLQNELLNVQVTLSRLAAQIVRFLFFLVIGVSLLLLASLLFPGSFTSHAFLLSLGALLLTGLCTASLFPKLFGAGPEKMEKRILGDHFEYHDKVLAFIESAHRHESRGDLFGELSSLVTRTIGVNTFALCFLNEAHGVYEVVCQPPGKSHAPLRFGDGMSLAPLFEKSRTRHFMIETIWTGQGLDEADALRREMLGLNMQVCLPLMAEGRHFGILMLGRKHGNAPYTATDIDLMEKMVENLGLVLNQFRLTDQILKTQEMELLGRMSRGIAHDMNNLLTPISTLLQLLEEGHEISEVRDLIPSARSNVETARAYVFNSLFFSSEKGANRRRNAILETARRAARNLEDELAKHAIQLDIDCPKPIHALYDESMMVRVFTNLVSNSIDASLPGSSIEIKCRLLELPRSSQNWLRVTVTDHGSGIPKESLDSIGKAYYTTKDTGDEKRGFGLGIPICKKIIEIHGGMFSIESEAGVGTRILFEIPTGCPQESPVGEEHEQQRHQA